MTDKLFRKNCVSIIPFNAELQKEIKGRLKREGGKSGTIRISLIWHNINDLDLHVITPSGEKIFFGHKNSKCGGKLDVDMNVFGESSDPVENIFWEDGKAPSGRYQVFVQNFKYHCKESHTPFIVEVSINGVSRFFKGVTSGVGSGSEQTVCRFTFRSGNNVQSKNLLRNIGCR